MGRMLLLAFLMFGLIVCLCSCDDIAVTRRRAGLKEQKQGARRCPGKRLCRRVCERGFKLNSRGCEICRCREGGPRTKPASVDRGNIERVGRNKEFGNSVTSSEDEVTTVFDSVNPPTLGVTVFQRPKHLPPQRRAPTPTPTPESPAPPTTLQGGRSTGGDDSACRGRRRYERVTSATNAIQEMIDTTECHVETMVVTFKDLGWDFVLSPTQFIAGFCQGSCPAVNGSENDIAEKSLDRNETLCCRPTKKVPSIRMIYVGKDMNISSGWLPNFIVTECGCTGESVYPLSNVLNQLFSRPYNCIERRRRNNTTRLHQIRLAT